MADTILGMELLLDKQSAVNAQGNLRVQPIEGVEFRPTRPVPHGDGHMVEVARSNWEIMKSPMVQVHVTTTLPDRVRAWGLHQKTTDRLFVVSGMVKFVIFDGRSGSPTFRKLNEFTISERNPALITVAPNLYHGWKNIGASEAVIINMPDKMYNYESPDSLDLPWDSDEARATVPYHW